MDKDTIKTVGVTTDTPLNLADAFSSGGLSLKSTGTTPTAQTETTVPTTQANGVINSASLAPVPVVSYPENKPQQAPAIPVNTVQAFLDNVVAEESQQLTAEQQKSSDLTNSLVSAIGGLTGEQQALGQAQQDAGVGDLKRGLQSINSQILTKQAELAQSDIQLIANMRNEEVRNTLLPFAQSAKAKLAGDAAILRALKTSEIGVLTAQALAKQGEIKLAIESAQQAVDTKYAPYKEQIAIYEAQLKALEPTLNAQEKKQASELLRKNQLADREIDNLRDTQKNFINEALRAEQPELASELIKATTKEQIANIASKIKYGNTLDDVYKKLQIQKLRADLNPSSNVDEYGRQLTSRDDSSKLSKEIVSGDAYKAITKASTSLRTLNNFEQLFKQVGTTSGITSPFDNAKLKPLYDATVLDLKEFFNLGVLNGPDLSVIQSVLPDPTSQGFITSPTAKTASKAGIESIKKMINDTLDERYRSIASQYQDYSPESVGSLKDAQNLYIDNKAKLDQNTASVVEKARALGATADDIIQIISN